MNTKTNRKQLEEIATGGVETGSGTNVPEPVSIECICSQ
jgi:hypothetical protein